jgi:hypothetical protein
VTLGEQGAHHLASGQNFWQQQGVLQFALKKIAATDAASIKRRLQPEMS